MKRYVIAAIVDTVNILDPASPGPGDPAAPPAKADHLPTIVDVSNDGVRLGFASYDPATQAAPDEVRAYFLKAGSPVPADIDGWLVPVPAIPASVATVPVPPEGLAEYLIPPPAGLATGDYMVAILAGFAE